jgi:hypothetical protein
MANNNSITAMYEFLPKIAKIIIQIALGWIVGGVYRIVRYIETKNTTTLVAGLLGLIPPIDVVLWVADIFTEATADKITFFAD